MPENGGKLLIETERTPGSAETRERRCRKKAKSAGSVPYFEEGRDTLNVRRWVESKPGSTPARRIKLRISKPEPASKTSARQICATTKALLAIRWRFPADEPRPPSLSVSEIAECAEM